MAISTYTELKDAVANWLDDTSLSSRIPEWITMGESRINRDLGKIRTSWTNEALNGTPSSRSIALPASFVEAQALFLTTDGTQKMLQPFINGTIELRVSDGTPKAWSINGTNIDLDCPCDAAHTFLFRYRQKWELSDGSPTSWLLTNHSDLYLAAALVNAFAWRRDSEQMLIWNTAYKQAVAEIEHKEARNLSITPLRTDPALLPVQGGSFSYTYGE